MDRKQEELFFKPQREEECYFSPQGSEQKGEERRSFEVTRELAPHLNHCRSGTKGTGMWDYRDKVAGF